MNTPHRKVLYQAGQPTTNVGVALANAVMAYLLSHPYNGFGIFGGVERIEQQGNSVRVCPAGVRFDELNDSDPGFERDLTAVVRETLDSEEVVASIDPDLIRPIAA